VPLSARSPAAVKEEPSPAPSAAAPREPVGIPRNRQPGTWAPWQDVPLGQYRPIQVRGACCCSLLAPTCPHWPA
jgi:hypothetical protein